MSKSINLGNKLSISVELPELKNLAKIKPYREKIKILKNKTSSRLVDEVPSFAGVYFLFHKDILLYVGNGANIRQRINNHTSKRSIKEVALQERFNPEHID